MRYPPARRGFQFLVGHDLSSVYSRPFAGSGVQCLGSGTAVSSDSEAFDSNGHDPAHPPRGKKQPFYHVVVTDSRMRQGGTTLEQVGYFNPVPAGKQRRLGLDWTRIDYWVGKGAKPSDRVAELVKKHRKQRRCGLSRRVATYAHVLARRVVLGQVRRAVRGPGLGQGSVVHRAARNILELRTLAARSGPAQWHEVEVEDGR